MDNKKINITKYQSPTGDFSGRSLEAARWYVKHKILLRKIGTAILAFFCLVTVGFSIYGWGNYLIFGFFEDRDMMANQVNSLNNVIYFHNASKVQELETLSAEIFSPLPGMYDIYTRAANPNERWLAEVRYYYAFSGSQTLTYKSYILPSSQGLLAILGHASETFPANARLVIDEIKWHKLNPHEISDVKKYVSERINFEVSNFNFVRAGSQSGVFSHRIEFDLLNNTAFNYWQPRFFVELISGGRVTGILPLSVDEFLSGETRFIDIRSPADTLEADNINLIPNFNIFDISEYIDPRS